jgi:hypothetical protein
LDHQLDKEAARRKQFGMSAEKQDLVQKDLDLWNKWNSGGRKQDDLRPLFTQFRGMIRSKTNEWKDRVEVPPVAIQAEVNKNFIRAMKTFNPDKGKLNSWVGTHLLKSNRWIGAHQNLGRIIENRSGKKVRQLHSAHAYLDESLGREPSHTELAEHLGWAPKTVETLQKELRKSQVASAFEVDPVDVMPSREREAMHMVYPTLSPGEQLVFDYTLGWHGKPELKPMQIADKLGYSGAKLSRIRKKITGELDSFLRR